MASTELAERLLARDRAAVPDALNLIDDRRPAKRDESFALLDRLQREVGDGGALRVGVTGAPGSGKSTLLDALVRGLRHRERSVGVIAVDPSSPKSGGALLGDRVRLRSAAGDVTYGALADNVNRCANLLRRLGIARGERVVMIVKDSAEFFYLFWGAIKCGVIPVPVSTLWRGHDYRYILEDSGCRAVVYSPEFASAVEAALESTVHRPAHVLVVEGRGGSLSVHLRMEG